MVYRLAMLMPVCCPACGKALLNTFFDDNNPKRFYAEKRCEKGLDHRFYCRSKLSSTEEIYMITISERCENPVYARWIFNSEKLFVWKGNSVQLNIPYFEPNLSDIQKLFKKLKTYILFS